MKTLQLFGIIALMLSLQSCSWNTNFGVSGNGEVTIEDRQVTEPFTAIKTKAGMNVILTQGEETQIQVETDSNLQEIIETKIEDGTLTVRPTSSIRKSKTMKVYVTCPMIEHLNASSGSRLQSTETIKSQYLTAKVSSGATMNIQVLSEDLQLDASSGSNLHVSGKAVNLSVDSSSGSTIKAKELESISTTAKASSGSSLTVGIVKETLEAKASSGANINYSGDPSVSANSSSSGRVRKRG